MQPFYPNKLLCKRFNVPDPYPNRKDDSAAGDSSKDALSQEIMDELMRERSISTRNEKVTSIPIGGHSEMLGSEKSLADISVLDSEKDIDVDAELEAFGGTGVADKEPERPPIDIFKAIFDSDGEEDDEEDKLEDQNDAVDSARKASEEKKVDPTIPVMPSQVFHLFQSVRTDLREATRAN